LTDRPLCDARPLGTALDAHLGQIFLTRKRKESRPAADVVDRFHLPHLRADEALGEVGEEPRYLVEVTALATTLAMNSPTRGKFEHG
jgi:hypothetical protein